MKAFCAHDNATKAYPFVVVPRATDSEVVVHVGHGVRLTSGPHRRARRTAYGHIHVCVQHATRRQTEVVAVVRSDGRTCTRTTASAGLAAGSAAAAEVVEMVAATADVVVATVV